MQTCNSIVIILGQNEHSLIGIILVLSILKSEIRFSQFVKKKKKQTKT